MSGIFQFIKGTGGCIVSGNILTGKGELKWCKREEPLNDVDNGWIFFSDIDTDEYVNNPDNMHVCDFNTVANIEPAVLTIYGCDVGTDLELTEKDGRKFFLDNNTGKEFVPYS